MKTNDIHCTEHKVLSLGYWYFAKARQILFVLTVVSPYPRTRSQTNEGINNTRP